MMYSMQSTDAQVGTCCNRLVQHSRTYCSRVQSLQCTAHCAQHASWPAAQRYQSIAAVSYTMCLADRKAAVCMHVVAHRLRTAAVLVDAHMV